MLTAGEKENEMSDRADVGVLVEGINVGAGIGAHDEIKWHAEYKLEKWEIPADVAGLIAELSGAEQISFLQDEGFSAAEVIEREGNLLMYGGVSALWQALIGNGTATAGQALTYFNNAQAALGVGDSTTAAVATQTDLVAATNKLRVGMDATFPTHTDATTSGAATITFKASFSSAQANWVWNEWGVFNSSTAATGRMLNRKVENLGTKTSAGAWALTITLTLA